VRVVYNTRFGRYRYYGCAYHARRGDSVCPNRTLLPQVAIERELLDLLQQVILTPATLDWLLAAVNTRLRAQATEARPRVKEIRRALVMVNREITNYTRAVGRGDLTSLETALTAAEQRRAALQAELAQLDGSKLPAVVQLTPAALERHLQGMTEKLRSGVNGKVREAIQWFRGGGTHAVCARQIGESRPSHLLGGSGVGRGLPSGGPGHPRFPLTPLAVAPDTHPGLGRRTWGPGRPRSSPGVLPASPQPDCRQSSDSGIPSRYRHRSGATTDGMADASDGVGAVGTSPRRPGQTPLPR
jgi:hypothetical protein